MNVRKFLILSTNANRGQFGEGSAKAAGNIQSYNSYSFVYRSAPKVVYMYDVAYHISKQSGKPILCLSKQDKAVRPCI